MAKDEKRKEKKLPREEVKTSGNNASTETKKKKKTYTIDEILAAGNVAGTDENGKKRRIKVKTKSKLKAREARWGYFFVFPWVIGACAFLIYPLFTAIYYSFCNVLTIPGAGIQATWIGMGNYERVLQTKTNIWLDLANFAGKMVIAVPLIVVFALLMSMLLNTKLKGKGVFRTIFFLPVIIVSGPVMGMMAGGNDVISAIDMTSINAIISGTLPAWMANAVIYVFQNITMFLWYSGVQILIFIAALQKIDTALYEAAKIDGGSGWECFWKITLPTIRPMILLNAIYTLIALSQDTNINPLINDIKAAMNNAVFGRAYAMAYSMIYTIVVLVLVIVVALLLMQKRDIYQKQIAKNKRFEKRTRRNMKKLERRMAKNAVKYEKHLEKQAQQKAKGKLKEEVVKGGKFDV